MKETKKEFVSKYIQTFSGKNQKKKLFTNKRKFNKLSNNKINLKGEEKFLRFRSLRDSLESFINDKQSKFFSTEVETNKDASSNRNNNSNMGGKKKLFNENNYCLSPSNNQQKKIFNSVMDMCRDLYEPKNTDNNKRMKLREDIIEKVNNYVNKDLKKNILFPKIVDNKKKIKNELIIPNKITKRTKLKSLDSNKINLKSMTANNSEQKNTRTINSRIVTYENYANNDTNYNHPQIYTLNNSNFKKYLLIKTSKNLKTSIDFSKLIPERKIDQKEINKQLYSVYKTMKKRKDITFHI